MRIAAVVLAAGRSTRFDGLKQLAEIEGRPLVAHAVDAARQGGLDPVLVVLGHAAPMVEAALPVGAVPVLNPRYAEGQATSLIAGVEAADTAGADALVVLLADQPGIDPTAVEAVATALAAGSPVVRATYDDRPGHPVGFARSTWARLLELTGDEGARQVIDELSPRDVPVAGPCPADIDTADDLPD